MKRVVVGLSGGVDSSVAAHLLQQQGYEVIGLFMKNWHDDAVTISNECPWLEDANDALLVAQKLGIPFQTIDLSEQYKEKIVDYMFREYKMGRTPNPDVLCNREIKFDVFMKIALSLGADFVATGHYCQKDVVEIDGQPKYRLLAGADANKDQSYFLCQLSQEQLSKALFPIGHLQKSEVRKIALEMDLVTAEKRDSQGLCFIGKVRLPEFLQQKLQPKVGNIVQIDKNHSVFTTALVTTTVNDVDGHLFQQSQKYDLKPEMGKIVGQHQGAHYFTIGQRKGLNVGGTTEPLFIIGTDVESNTVFVGLGSEHPGLFRSSLRIDPTEVHGVRNDLKPQINQTMNVLARSRYRQPLQNATLHQLESGTFLVFEQPQSAIASGQFAAWYLGDELVGSGVIA